MNDVISKLAVGGSSSYSPTIVDADKYEKLRRGRNKFFFSVVSIAGAVAGAYAVPHFIVRKHATSLFKQHCSGRVLDLVPKVGDTATVGLLEASRAVRVEFLVDELVIDDGNYRLDESLPEAQQVARRLSMTLDHTCRQDELWVTSPVTFAVVPRPEVLQRSAEDLYDTVMVRHELCNLDDAAVANIVGEGVRLLKPGGKLLVVEVGRGSVQWVNRLVKWYHEHMRSTLFLSREYDKMPFALSPELECVHFKKQLLGFHHTIAWQKRRT
jgi:SAM-dependent methyltransferase